MAGASPAAPTIYGRRPDRRGQRFEPARAPCGPLGCESLAFRHFLRAERFWVTACHDAPRITHLVREKVLEGDRHRRGPWLEARCGLKTVVGAIPIPSAN